MGALHLLDHFGDAGITLYMDGDTLKAKPVSKLNDVHREVIRSNKAALIEVLKHPSAYWLIDGVMLTTHAPPSTFEQVQAMYPMRSIEPLSPMAGAALCGHD
jgi:TubC N-terminal docking domain